MAYEVSIARCGTYDENMVRAAVEESLRPLGGLGSVVKKGDRVLVKLNLLAAKRPEQAVTTHPVLARVVVKMLQELGAVPAIGDSPGGRTTASYGAVLETTGMQAVAADTGCAIARFNDETVEISSDKARTYKRLKFARAVLDADVIIGLPRLKTHQLTYYTGAVKLQYGYITGRTKTEYHFHTGRDVSLFAEMLMDIHDTRPADLYIMDAIVGMEGNGPSGGTPRDIGLVMSSKSATALDFVATSVVGMDPLAVSTVKKALERGSGPGKLDDIRIHGESIASVAVKDFKMPDTMELSHMPGAVKKILTSIGGTRPQIDRMKCRKCGVCVRDCPAHAMTMTRGAIPGINYGQCIRCYCCQELCPENAVYVRTPFVRRIIK